MVGAQAFIAVYNGTGGSGIEGCDRISAIGTWPYVGDFEQVGVAGQVPDLDAEWALEVSP